MSSNKFSKDELYAMPITELVDFTFDEKTVAVFPDMINRSVPGYSLMQSLTGLVAKQKVARQSSVYDLGCSLGASSLSVMNSVPHQEYELILIDQSASMVEHCQSLFKSNESPVTMKIKQADIRDLQINNASMVMLNLVLQFLPLEDRQNVIESIYDGLLEGGVLLLSEKVELDTDLQKQQIESLYVEFKKRSGYSELEISQKRQALERVMQTQTLIIHQDRLKKAGFSLIMPVMQALNFVTIMAIK